MRARGRERGAVVRGGLQGSKRMRMMRALARRLSVGVRGRGCGLQLPRGSYGACGHSSHSSETASKQQLTAQKQQRLQRRRGLRQRRLRRARKGLGLLVVSNLLGMH